MEQKEKTKQELTEEINLLNKRLADLEMSENKHKIGAAYREIGRKILEILNEPGDLQAAIQRVLAALKTGTGFDAIGIRLQDGEDFPYFVQEGFPKDFLQKENSLLERTQDGGICRNSDGSIRLECTCGMVLSGKTAAADQLCTPGGSIWTNDSFSLLEIPLDEDPRHHSRNECIHQGYASAALVPIKIPGKIIGLIHLNDRRKECFTIEMVELLEGIGAYIGAALMRKQSEEAERENVDKMKRMNRQMMGREKRVIELKKEVNKLCQELGRPEPYSVVAF